MLEKNEGKVSSLFFDKEPQNGSVPKRLSTTDSHDAESLHFHIPSSTHRKRSEVTRPLFPERAHPKRDLHNVSQIYPLRVHWHDSLEDHQPSYSPTVVHRLNRLTPERGLKTLSSSSLYRLSPTRLQPLSTHRVEDETHQHRPSMRRKSIERHPGFTPDLVTVGFKASSLFDTPVALDDLMHHNPDTHLHQPSKRSNIAPRDASMTTAAIMFRQRSDSLASNQSILSDTFEEEKPHEVQDFVRSNADAESAPLLDVAVDDMYATTSSPLSKPSVGLTASILQESNNSISIFNEDVLGMKSTSVIMPAPMRLMEFYEEHSDPHVRHCPSRANIERSTREHFVQRDRVVPASRLLFRESTPSARIVSMYRICTSLHGAAKVWYRSSLDRAWHLWKNHVKEMHLTEARNEIYRSRT